MTRKTPTLYQSVYDRLIKRYMNETGRETIIDQEIATWLITRVRPGLLPNSWRTYRNSVCEYLSTPHVITQLKESKPLNTKRTIKALSTSRQRDKGITHADLTLLSQHLSTAKSMYAKPLLTILHATLKTGLRPEEWKSARLIPSTQLKGALAIKCANAKAKMDSNGLIRQDGNYKGQSVLVERTIDLSHLASFEINHVRMAIDLVKALVEVDLHQSGALVKYFKNLAQAMYVATRATLGNRAKYPTLYSARHQFASNLKASYRAQGIPELKRKRMLAVLMGQGSIKTSTYNYGNTHRGDITSEGIEPIEAEIKYAQGLVGELD